MNIPRYVDTFEEEEPVDMADVGLTIREIRKEKAGLEASLLDMISSLQYDKGNEEWIKGAIEVFKHEK